MLFSQDFILAFFEDLNSEKYTGLFFFQNPSLSPLKSGNPDAVLMPAPDKNVIL